MAANIQEILAQNPHLKEGEKKKYWNIDVEKGKIIYFLRTKTHTEGLFDPEEWVRAAFLIELLEKYQYMSGFIEFETEMPKRVPNQFADIVIYDEENISPFIVIECKRDGITDAEFEQSVKQGVGNGNILAAQYSGAVAGSTRRFFKTGKFDPKNPIENTLSDIPRKYGKPEEWKYRKGDEKWDLREVTAEELKTILSKCHQTIWRGGKRNPAEAFGEVAKIIFVKIWDEKHLTKRGDYYKFQRKSDEPVEKVKQRIASIYAEAQLHDPEVFKEEIKLDPEEVTAVVEHLQTVSLSRTDLDVKGEAFQRFMGNFFKGDFGQYFTPTPTVKFCIQLFRNELNNRHSVLDPACGSGGFLLQALDFIRIQANKEFDLEDPREATEHYAYWHNFAKDNLFGIEINEAIARVAKMNMILHDDGHTNVIGHDSLDHIEKMSLKNQSFENEKFDFIFTNPPFGSTIKGSEHPYIQHYELAKNGKKQRDNQKSEILFIERCWEFLKPGTGKMAIVLPDGILTNSSLQYVRDWVMEHFQILAVISLPQDAFRYYGAGVKSSVLALRKYGPDDDRKADYPIFMANPQQIGIDATGRKCKNDLEEVAENFEQFQKNPGSFFLSESERGLGFLLNFSDIQGSLSAALYMDADVEIIGSRKLNEIAAINPRTTKPSVIDGNVPYVGLPECSLTEIENIILRSEKEVSSRKLCKVHDILFARIEPSVFNKKYVFVDDLKGYESCFVSTEFYVVRANKAVCDPKFLYYMFFDDRVFAQTAGKTTGSTGRRRLDIGSFSNLKIPSPDLAIQKKIVEIMDNALAESKQKIKKAQEILSSIDRYLMEELEIVQEKEEVHLSASSGIYTSKQSNQNFATHRNSVNSNWDVRHFLPKYSRNHLSIENSKYGAVNLGSLAEIVRRGKTPQYIESGIPVIKIGSIKKGVVIPSEEFVSKEFFDASSNAQVKEGDLLISATGEGSIGKVGIYSCGKPALADNHTTIIRLDIQKAIPLYIAQFLRIQAGILQIEHAITGSTGQTELYPNDIQNILIPLPPMEEQKRIVDWVQSKQLEYLQVRQTSEQCIEEAKKEVESMLLTEHHVQ